MKTLSENIYLRGKHNMVYVRRRIPAAIRSAYPLNTTHIVRSLGTSDIREGKARARLEMTRIDAEFEQKRQELELSRATQSAKRISKLSDEQLQDTAQFWIRNVLQLDEQQRQAGLTDDEFDALGARLKSQRAELGRLLAQGKALNIFPALHSFLYLCGLDYKPDEAEAKRASYAFLRSVVTTLEHQLSRQAGNVVETDAVASPTLHPLQNIAPERAPAATDALTWDTIFSVWRDYVDNRPKSTTIAAQTPWRDLSRFAETHNITSPAAVTPVLMTRFTESMRERGLAVDTINERISKIRAIYKIAVGKHILEQNPAERTLGFKENSVQQRTKRRLPFDTSDLNLLFGSEIYTQHKRSRGQSGEASYWIPLLMYYSGARPEEIAGLALADVREDPEFGWYFSIEDRPGVDDKDLFDGVPNSHRRTLKNEASIRRVPVAQELIDLGLLRYIETVRSTGATVLFPTLTKDWHGKLSGAFSKFFGRYKRHVGIEDDRKVLYSFRHTMKDFLEEAKVPTKYLQRMLGHTTGDGAITDGYGSDLPFEHIVENFKKVNFHPISALPWEPGRGSVSLNQDE
jgi:integrase